MSDVVVVGSMNVDLTVRVGTLPGPGETVLGGPASYTCGGKGGNQAVAAARLLGDRGRVRMVGLVGADDHGDMLMADLRQESVDVDQVHRLDDVGTGIAMICVDDAGENLIVVSPGANAAWADAHVAAVAPAEGDVVVCQLEIPLEVAAAVIADAHERGARVVLNAAPAHALPPDVLAGVDVLVVNETEATQVLGSAPDTPARLDELGAGLPCGVVVTLGSRGAIARPAGGPAVHVPTVEVDVVSAVGAGDAFVGALAVDLLDGHDLITAVRRACAAGALAVAAPGARGGLPRAEELEAFMEGVPC